MHGHIDLGNGVTVGYAECGDPDGAPVLYLHGAPGSRLEAGPTSVFASDLASAGIRFIGMERPGYGISTDQPGQRINDAVHDIRAFADHLGLERFAVIGWSAGGPPALATGARLADRVSAVGAIASIAPITAVGLDDVGERDFLELADRDPDALRSQMKELAAAMRDDPATASLTLLGDILSDADVGFVMQPEINAVMLANLQESARREFAGYADDCISQIADWGFALADVGVPVTLIHGTDDKIVPVTHSRYLARQLPNASLIEYAGDGHISALSNLVELATEITGP